MKQKLLFATLMLAISSANSARVSAQASRPAGRLPVLNLNQIFTLPPAAKDNDKLSLEEIRAFLENPNNHKPFAPRSPLGLGDLAAHIPADNPMTKAKVELGRQLYFDPRLSRDSTIACATCHAPNQGWTTNTPVSTGIKGQQGGRNGPTVLNRIFGKTQFWDGRAATLEEQSLGPIQNPIEMDFTLPELLARLNTIEGYRIQFEKIFGKVSPEAIAKAIASFERTVVTGASPVDYFDQARPFAKLTDDDVADDKALAAKRDSVLKAAAAHPLSESAKRGRELFFGKANCSLCHVGANFSDEDFYNIGLGATTAKPDAGRAIISNQGKDTGAYKVPSLRNISKTGPYMHDGSQKTLAEVVEYYDRGGNGNPHLHQRIKKLNLTKTEKEDLVAFMEALSGPLPNIPLPRLP